MDKNEKLFICPKEAALSLGVSEGSVRRWLRDGRVRGAVKVCGTWLLPSGFALHSEAFVREDCDV